MKSKVEWTLKDWVSSCAELAKPDRVQWCDGTEAEYQLLLDKAIHSGELIRLNGRSFPRCFLHRSSQNDVARTEEVTFICTKLQEDAGPSNNWMDPGDAHQKVDALFEGSMQGRTMYVVPYIMGPTNSPYARYGVEITDSIYVVLNMRIMTRMGHEALQKILADDFSRIVKGFHSTGDLDPSRRFIMHFPEEMTIKSIGSGYGGNALLGKKCHALRLGSWQARKEGWLAEHMLIIGVESPTGQTHYVAAAFPSACGKTNLAMLLPPEKLNGYRVWTVGDDICWMHMREDGRLWAINPENGFFGVVPGTSQATNPTALSMIRHDTIFTNVALTADNEPWWEGLTPEPPPGLLDWQGRAYDSTRGPAAHPNARFTVAAKQCPSFSLRGDDPRGVPISAIIFGGRRADLVPLVTQAFNWRHGVIMGASMASETTAAASGKTGVLRRDPMAMRPFCGYNMGDYWNHWLSFGLRYRAENLPKIFQVNWFRKDDDGAFLWKGFGENLRVLLWILDRCEGRGKGVNTPIGCIPSIDAVNIDGLDLDRATMQKLLHIDRDKWLLEIEDIQRFFASFGRKLPEKLKMDLIWIEQEMKLYQAEF